MTHAELIARARKQWCYRYGTITRDRRWPVDECPPEVVEALLDVLAAVENDAGEAEAEQVLHDNVVKTLTAIEEALR